MFGKTAMFQAETWFRILTLIHDLQEVNRRTPLGCKSHVMELMIRTKSSAQVFTCCLVQYWGSKAARTSWHRQYVTRNWHDLVWSKTSSDFTWLHPKWCFMSGIPASFRMFNVGKWYFERRLKQLEVHRPITNDTNLASQGTLQESFWSWWKCRKAMRWCDSWRKNAANSLQCLNKESW